MTGQKGIELWHKIMLTEFFSYKVETMELVTPHDERTKLARSILTMLYSKNEEVYNLGLQLYNKNFPQNYRKAVGEI